MSNKTIIECPYCHYQGEEELGYDAFAMFHKSPSRFHSMKDGKPEEAVESEAITECDKCGKRFLYKLEIRIIAKTSAIDYEEPGGANG